MIINRILLLNFFYLASRKRNICRRLVRRGTDIQLSVG